MSKKHTPGPWHVADNDGAHCTVRAKHGGETIAKVWLQGNDFSDADARLIASAPDMLRALKMAAEHLPPEKAAMLGILFVIAKAEE